MTRTKYNEDGSRRQSAFMFDLPARSAPAFRRLRAEVGEGMGEGQLRRYFAEQGCDLERARAQVQLHLAGELTCCPCYCCAGGPRRGFRQAGDFMRTDPADHNERTRRAPSSALDATTEDDTL